MEINKELNIRERANKDYMNGMKYSELAEKYEVSINTIKSWKRRYSWKRSKKNSEMQEQKKVCKAHKGAPLKNKNAKGNKGGAPKGNKNAKGYGAPRHNNNAVSTGEFETILWDTLDDEEKELVNKMPEDKGTLLKQEMQLLTIRERRMMKRINQIKDEIMNSKLNVDNGQAVENSEKKKDVMNRVIYIEDALTRIQDKKSKLISEIHKWEMDYEKLTLEKSRIQEANEYIIDDGFIEALESKIVEVWDYED